MILYPAGIFQEYKANIISISCILRTENNFGKRNDFAPNVGYWVCPIQYAVIVVVPTQ